MFSFLCKKKSRPAPSAVDVTTPYNPNAEVADIEDAAAERMRKATTEFFDALRLCRNLGLRTYIRWGPDTLSYSKNTITSDSLLLDTTIVEITKTTVKKF